MSAVRVLVTPADLSDRDEAYMYEYVYICMYNIYLCRRMYIKYAHIALSMFIPVSIYA